MSHIPQREEKDCLNCGTIVQGRYCQQCGQENVVPHETFWHMVRHFLYDITHFDSKFFDSMKFLLLKPGFLPQEYIRGRRASYLNPIKKYVFTSAVFFLLFFGFFVKPGAISVNLGAPLSPEDRMEMIQKGEKELLKNPKNEKWVTALQMLKDTGRVLTQEDMFRYWDDLEFINLGGPRYKNRREYDSVQKSLPPGKRDGWVMRTLQRKNLKLKEKYSNDPRTGVSKISDTFLHKLPYLLFVSLPIFALILKLLYIRHKKIYYVDHGIFALYHYIFTFILLLFVFTFDKLANFTGWGILEWLMGLLFLSGGVYLYLSLKRFYGQGHGKTVLKFVLLNIAGLLMLIILFLVFVLFSVFEL